MSHDFATQNAPQTSTVDWEEARRRWVSTREVSAYLGKSRAWIAGQIKRDEDPLPHRKTTGGYLYRLDEIDAWIDAEGEREETQRSVRRRRRLEASRAEARAAQ